MEFQETIRPSQVKPIGKNVLLKRHASNEKIGQIETPENRIERNLKCTVIAVNSGRWFLNKGRVPSIMKAGDVVLVRQWRGIPLNVNDETVVFVPDDLIEGICLEEKPVPVE